MQIYNTLGLIVFDSIGFYTLLSPFPHSLGTKQKVSSHCFQAACRCRKPNQPAIVASQEISVQVVLISYFSSNLVVVSYCATFETESLFSLAYLIPKSLQPYNFSTHNIHCSLGILESRGYTILIINVSYVVEFQVSKISLIFAQIIFLYFVDTHN